MAHITDRPESFASVVRIILDEPVGEELLLRVDVHQREWQDGYGWLFGAGGVKFAIA